MAITPSTRVRLCTVPFDASNQHVIRFTSAEAQLTYFVGKTVQVLENFTYQRRDNVIKAGVNIDSIQNVNYVAYQNDPTTSKWYYAFVTKMEYVSEAVTHIHIETDVYQTWLFDTSVGTSFVVREHVANDAVGANTVEEGLEYGEYVYNQSGQDYADLTDLCMIVGMTVNNVAPFAKIVGSLQDGVYSGIGYFFYNADATGATALSTMLGALDADNKITSVVSISMFARSLVPAYSNGQRIPSNAVSATYKMITVGKKTSGPLWDLGSTSYTPKNNKLYCHPYNFLAVANRTGHVTQYRWEWFTETSTANFRVVGDIVGAPTVWCVPQLYRGGGRIGASDNNWDEAISMSGWPMCPFNSDVYKNWFAQNTVGMGLQLLASGVAVGVGVATLNPIAVGGGAMGIASVFGQAYEKSILPPTVKGMTNSQNGRVVLGLQDFVFYPMHIKIEHMKRLDTYFEMFGYKVATLKVPNLTGRPYWNYVKCIDVNITGDIPSDDMLKLKRLYNDGLTLWHTTTGYLNFGLDNH